MAPIRRTGFCSHEMGFRQGTKAIVLVLMGRKNEFHACLNFLLGKKCTSCRHQFGTALIGGFYQLINTFEEDFSGCSEIHDRTLEKFSADDEMDFFAVQAAGLMTDNPKRGLKFYMIAEREGLFIDFVESFALLCTASIHEMCISVPGVEDQFALELARIKVALTTPQTTSSTKTV